MAKRRKKSRAKVLTTGITLGIILGTIITLVMGGLGIWIHYTNFANVKEVIRVVPDPECEMNRVLGRVPQGRPTELPGIY